MEYISPLMHQEYTFRHRSFCRTPADSRQESLTTGKEYIDPCKIWQNKWRRRKAREWAGLILHPVDGGNETAIVQDTGEEFETVQECSSDLRLAEWNENNTDSLATSVRTLENDATHPSKTASAERGHQRADRLEPQSQKTNQSNHVDHILV